MSSVRAQSKRGLREVLEAGVAFEEMRAAQETGVVYDVLGSHGEQFGLCVRTRTGHVYVKPDQLLGVPVVSPMVVRPHANTACLVAALATAVREELSR